MSDFSKAKIGLFLFCLCIFFTSLLFLIRFRLPETIKSDEKNEIEKLKSSNQLQKVEINAKEYIGGKANGAPHPTPLIKQQGKANGENSIIKFEKDLETSLNIQEVPKIWLEYVDEYNEINIVKIPKKVQDYIKKRWFNTLRYSHQNQSTNDRETKINIYENYINDAAVYATKIDDFEIVTPQEKRNISQEEAFAIIHLTAKFAVERYVELQKMALQLERQKNGD